MAKPTKERLRHLQLAALEEARSDIGKGEIGGNNEGPYVRNLMTLFRHRTAGPWCAAAVSAWYTRAADKLGMRVPWQLSASARITGARMQKVGRRLMELEPLEPGDVVVWWRGRLSGRKGHIGIVEYSHPRGLGRPFLTVEGNYGKYPAKVDVFCHHRDGEKILGFYRLW